MVSSTQAAHINRQNGDDAVPEAPTNPPEHYTWRTGDVITDGDHYLVLFSIGRWMIEYVTIRGDLDHRWSLDRAQKVNSGLLTANFHRHLTRAEFADLTRHRQDDDFVEWDRLPKKGETYLFESEIYYLNDPDLEIDINTLTTENYHEMCPQLILGRKGDLILVIDLAYAELNEHRTWTTRQPKAGAPWEVYHLFDFMAEANPKVFLDPAAKATVVGWSPRYPVDEAISAGREEMRRMQEYIDKNRTEAP